MHKLIVVKKCSLDVIKDSVSFHSSVQTLYEYRGNQSYDLKSNPILNLDGVNPDRDIWATPRWLIERLESEFGKFTLDACADEKNKVCEKYFSQEQNSLLQDWDCEGLIWLNPPYSDKSSFIEKAHTEARKGRKIILLAPAFTETKWFSEMKAKSDWLLFLSGRLVFNEHKQKETAKFSSVLAFFNIEKTDLANLGWSV